MPGPACAALFSDLAGQFGLRRGRTGLDRVDDVFNAVRAVPNAGMPKGTA